jgi:type VI secretion system protein ImpJ
MRALTRVVWSEGMHLAQHHFQTQSAYFEEVAGATMSALFHAPWGLLDLQLDEPALLNGTAAIMAGRGILPDGTPFSFPDDAPPEPLRVADRFSPTQASHILLLGLPEQLPGRPACALDDAAHTSARFSVVQRAVPDETTGGDERPVQVARKNFRLLLDTDEATDLSVLPIARIRRDGAGHFVYDVEYIPPALRVAASPQLRALAVRIIEMLEARADVVRSERSGGSGQAEYASREIAGFWFLHALNSAIPPLRHAARTGSMHPEQLYVQLSQLAGALCTFSLSSHPRELPAYTHEAPEDCFRRLEQHIRRHLDVVRPEGALAIPLQRIDESFWVGAVGDRRCFEPTAHWFLGVRSSASAADVISRTPKLVKACSGKIIRWLAQKAHSGLSIEHVPSPPPELSPRIGTQYFSMRRTNPCWDSVLETAEVGLYVPGALPDPELELRVVLERKA